MVWRFDVTSPMDGYCPLKFRAPASVQGAPAGRKEWLGTTLLAYLQESQATYGLAKFCAAAGAANATTRATAIMSFFMGVSFREGVGLS